MAKKLRSTRPRAHTANAGVKTDRDVPTGPLRPETAREDSSQTNRSWPLGAAKEKRKTITKAPRVPSLDPNSPASLNGSTASLSRGSPPRLESVNESSDDQKIGIALGSPSKVQSRTIWTDALTMSPPGMNGPIQNTSLKRKPSKWKKLGGLFKSKNPELPERMPFYEVRVNDQQLQTLDSLEYMPDVHLRNRPLVLYDVHPWPSRSQSLPRPGEWPAEAVDTSNFEPSGSRGLKGSSQEQNRWGRWSEEPVAHQGPRSNGAVPFAPRLDVDIPDVEMDRYSVMFGSFYGTAPKPNLLARRDEQLDGLRAPNATQIATRNDLSRLRRATSPGPAKSPTFPHSSSNPTANASKAVASHSLSRGPTLLQKSHTLPTSTGAPYYEMASRSKQSLQSPTETSESSETRWPSVSHHSTAPSELDCESSDEDYETVRLRIKPPEQEEPAWEMITPIPKPLSEPDRRKPRKPTRSEIQSNTARTEKLPPESASAKPEDPTLPEKGPSSSLPFQCSSPQPRSVANGTDAAQPAIDPGPGQVSPSSPGSVHKSNPSLDSYTDDFQTVEVAVARSVSVCKRNKRVLVPIGGKANAHRSNERLVEKKVATPTAEVVHKGHRYEKSRVAVLENA
ncbi:hypothetical protein PRK78_004658 [Emydomyces testavorans]|uniref:Uncharacterized protein n=1 Tax=Emydomyces testavorans TaxID=2070801 RepID=A0AAF0ILW1_9EURO|nr:hypothetical protein PRK78_004658 [Emydomyces testavorans]